MGFGSCCLQADDRNLWSGRRHDQGREKRKRALANVGVLGVQGFPVIFCWLARRARAEVPLRSPLLRETRYGMFSYFLLPPFVLVVHPSPKEAEGGEKIPKTTFGKITVLATHIASMINFETK